MRRHSSYLLRCWEMSSDGERIEVEHIQSGTKVLARSVTDAVEWICAQDDAATQLEPAIGQTRVEVDSAGAREGEG